MSYPEQYRRKTVEYCKEGHTLAQTSKVFKVNVSTITEWEKRLEEKGSLADREVKRPFKKIDPEKLRLYVKNNPHAFKCCPTTIRKALQRLKITRKKKDDALQGTVSGEISGI